MFDWLNRYFPEVSGDGTTTVSPQQGPSMDDYRAAQAKAAAMQRINGANADQQRLIDVRDAQISSDNAAQVEAARRQAAQQALSANRTGADAPPASTWEHEFFFGPGGMFGPQGPGAPTEDRADRASGMPNVPMDVVPVVPETPTLPPQTDPTHTAAPDDPIDAIRQKQAMIDQIYPAAPVPDAAAQGAADKEAEKEKLRAQYLAQLAFFSGITQGAGGSWEGVGRGLAGAGQAYVSGFDRYQKALQNKADRGVEQQQMMYKDKANRADAAVKLYSSDQENKRAAMSEGRKAIKDRQDQIDEYFKQRLKLTAGEGMIPDQSAVDQIMKEWQISRDRGEVIRLNDLESGK